MSQSRSQADNNEQECKNEENLREETELVNSEQAQNLNIEQLAKQKGIVSINADRDYRNTFDYLAETIRKAYGPTMSKDCLNKAVAFAGKEWKAFIGVMGLPPGDYESDGYHNWQRGLNRFKRNIVFTLGEFVKNDRPFDWAAATKKFHDPNNDELQARSDAHKQELEV